MRSYVEVVRQRKMLQRQGLIHSLSKDLMIKTMDAGPANWVEQDAGMPIIDASPAGNSTKTIYYYFINNTVVCSYLFNVGSCGWSDRFTITAVTTEETQEGPVPVTPEEYERIVNRSY